MSMSDKDQYEDEAHMYLSLRDFTVTNTYTTVCASVILVCNNWTDSDCRNYVALNVF